MKNSEEGTPLAHTEFTVSLTFEVYIDLDGFNGEEVTAEDIANHRGSDEINPDVHPDVIKDYIKQCIDPLDMVLQGSVQTEKINYVTESL